MAVKKKIARKKPAPKKKKYKETKKRVNRRKKKAFDVKSESPIYSYTTLVRRYLTAGKPCSYLPGELLEKFTEYVEYVDENPLYEEKAFSNGLKTTVKHIRAMTIQGFTMFACMHRSTFNDYEKRPEYADIIKFIRDVMYTQKYEGAAANLLNSNIVGRDLGLIDRQANVDNDGNAILAWNYITPHKPVDENQ